MAEQLKDTINVKNLSCMKHFQNAKLLFLSKEAIEDDNDDDENAGNAREYQKEESIEKQRKKKKVYFLTKLLEGTTHLL